MKDDELFELCKEVYKRTGWVHGGQTLSRRENGVTKEWTATYDSDYLLEKLPKNIGSYGLEMWSYPTGDGVAFGYYDTLAKRWHQTIPQRGDRSPLKALLKLVIALDDAEVKL